MSVVWHDLECGNYDADLPIWEDLAGQFPGPILDVGAGTGRVALALARTGHAVTALDSDAALLAELERRAEGLDLETVTADARNFELERRFSLCIAPMQTIQLLGGADGRLAFLDQARRHLLSGGRLAVALADDLDLFELRPGGLGPLPDVTERDGVVYSSTPTAVRVEGDGFQLERRREIVSPEGRLSCEMDRIHLDRLDSDRLISEGQQVGLKPVPVLEIAPTREYVGSVVVMFDA